MYIIQPTCFSELLIVYKFYRVDCGIKLIGVRNTDATMLKNQKKVYDTKRPQKSNFNKSKDIVLKHYFGKVKVAMAVALE